MGTLTAKDLKLIKIEFRQTFEIESLKTCYNLWMENQWCDKKPSLSRKRDEHTNRQLSLFLA